MNYFIAKNNEWLPYLEEELADLFSRDCVLRVADLPLVKVEQSIKNINVGLSLNALPETTHLGEGSIGQQSDKIIELVGEVYSKAERINLRVFSLSAQHCVVTTGRAEILRDRIHKGLRKRGHFLQSATDFDNCHQLQIMIFPDRDLAVSILHTDKVKEFYQQLLSPFVGGYTTIADDKNAPSRAFKKLVEAQLDLGTVIQKDEHVVDLGACPGGWSYVARSSDAIVTAIDRSAVREDLLHDPKVEFIQTDAFQFKTERPIDWVVSDIICTPERILELMDTWVVSDWCRHFVFTIKFQGHEGYGVLQEFKKLIRTLDHYRIILRQLNVNKNEVTIMGEHL